MYEPICAASIVHPELLDGGTESDKIKERGNPAVERILPIARLHVCRQLV
jgi:hypothetical protein